MKKELIIVFLAVCSWTASTFFTDGVETIVDKEIGHHHNKAIVYFSCSLLFILIIVILSKYTGNNLK
jgi:hypothetical protein